MFCDEGGVKLNDTAKFCDSCGAVVFGLPSASVPQAAGDRGGKAAAEFASLTGGAAAAAIKAKNHAGVVAALCGEEPLEKQAAVTGFCG